MTSRLLLALVLVAVTPPALAQGPAPQGPASAAQASAPDASRDARRLARSLEALRAASVLAPPQMPDGIAGLLPPPANPAPEIPFSTRAGCAAALGMAAVGAEGTLTCRALVDRFPFLGAEPTPARLPTEPLPPDADRG